MQAVLVIYWLNGKLYRKVKPNKNL